MEENVESSVIGISLSPEVETLLAENDVDLTSEIIRRVKGTSATPPDVRLPRSDTGLKDLTLTILASAAAAPLVAAAIAQVIDAIASAKRAKVTEVGDKEAAEVVRTYKLSFLGLKVELSETRRF
jgi:hypothetical protein